MEENGQASLVPQVIPSRREIAPLSAETVEHATENLKVLKQLKKLAISYTNPKNWTDFGGTPYLDENGCMKFAEVFGVSFRNINFEKEEYSDEKGPVLQYFVTLDAEFRGRVVSSDGAASSKDQFFNRRDAGKLIRLPLSEISIPNIRKKAATNAKARATKAILGLSFSWEEVEDGLKFGGKDPKTVGKVAFKGKSGKKKSVPEPIPSPPPKDGPAADAEEPPEKVTPDKEEIELRRHEIGDMLLLLCGEDKEAAQERLEMLTTFEGRDGKQVRGKKHLKDLTDKQVPVIWRKIKKEVEQATDVNEGVIADEDIPF